MKKLIIILIILIVLTGICVSFLNLNNEDLRLAISGTSNKPSPADRIKENQIQIYPDKIIIFVSNATLVRYAPTRSMDPVLDSGANGIEIVPDNAGQIQVGDIIAYQPKNTDNLIVHRVIKISTDEEGWYCIAKGDNAIIDDGQVRFEQIKYLTIAIIY